MGAAAKDIVTAVRERTEQCIVGLLGPLLQMDVVSQLTGGKLLRSKLGARVACCPDSEVSPEEAIRACSAVELVHAASLCHDDVIDGARLRRGLPALHHRLSPKSAILVGDTLLAGAFGLIAKGRPGLMPVFAARIGEVAVAEAKQELQMLGAPAREQSCMRTARSLTGPLFAFPAEACAGSDERLLEAAREAGYRLGTAYQLADDLLDVRGSEQEAGKTLGTDAIRGKPTLAAESPEQLTERVRELCASAAALLADWPGARRAVQRFLALDLHPVLRKHLPELAAALRATPLAAGRTAPAGP